MAPATAPSVFLNRTVEGDMFNMSIPEVNNPMTSGTVGGTTVNASVKPENREMTWDDATWILTSSFIIFTMQSG